MQEEHHAVIRLENSLRWNRLVQVAQTAGQVMALALFSWGAEAVVRQVGAPLPSRVIGLFLVLLLLQLKLLPLGWVKAGADWLVAELLLFFVPAIIAVVQYEGQLRLVAWQVVFVLIASTAMVMLGTAVAVDWSHRVERWVRLRGIRRKRARRIS